MANTITVELLIDDKKYKAELAGAEKLGKKKGTTIGKETGEGFSNSFAGTLKNGLSVALGLGLAAVTTQLTRAFTGSIAAANRQEDAIASLNSALKRSGEFSEAATQDLQDFASSIQAISIFGDEAVLEQLALAKTFGLTTEQAKLTIQAATELSAASGGIITFDSAVRNIAKTFSGLKGELGENVSAIRNLTAEQLRAGEAARVILAQNLGAASAQAATARGQFTQLSNAFGDLTEKLGEYFTKSEQVKESTSGLTGLVKLLTDSLTVGELPLSRQIEKIQERIAALNKEIKGGQGSVGFRDFFISDATIQKKQNEILKLQQVLQDLDNQREEQAKKAASTAPQDIAPSFSAEQINARLQAIAQVGLTEQQIREQNFATQRVALENALAADILTEEQFLIRGQELRRQFDEADAARRAEAAAKRKQERDAELNALANSALSFESFGSQLSAGFESLAKQSQLTGKQVASALTQGIGNAAGSAFASFGKALASGENALAAFGEALLASFGNALIQQGTGFILQGVAQSLAGFGSGAPLIAAGAAMATFGGALTALGGSSKPATPAAGPIGSTTFAPTTPAESITTDGVVEDRQEQARVVVNIAGDVLDSTESSLRIIELIENAGFESGARVLG